jgi:Tfp pilus assembly protein PilV
MRRCGVRRSCCAVAGFTMLEAVVALLVMMVVGLGAASLFLYAIRYNQGAAERAMALAVAQQKLEELRAVSWDDPLLDATNGTHICTQVAPCYSGDRAFLATKTITDTNIVTVNGVPRATTKNITISVTPVPDNLHWSPGSISVSAQRATLVRGPY